MYGRGYARSLGISTFRSTTAIRLEGERARLYASDNIRYELGMSCGMLGTTRVIMSLATTVDLIHTSRVMYAHTAHIALPPMYHGDRVLLSVWCYVTYIVRIRNCTFVYSNGTIGVERFNDEGS